MGLLVIWDDDTLPGSGLAEMALLDRYFEVLVLVQAFWSCGCRDCSTIGGAKAIWGVDIDCSKNSVSWTAMEVERCHQALQAYNGNTPAVKMEHLNHPEPTTDWTVLMVASHEGHYDLVKKLLDNGAGEGINMKDRCGWTALMLAAYSGSSVDVVRLLLSHNADINHFNNYSRSALYMAANNGHGEVVKLLLENKANPRQRDIYQVSILTKSVYSYINQRCNHELVRDFLKLCETADAINQALWTAVDHCCPTIVADLLNSGVQIFDPIKLSNFAASKSEDLNCNKHDYLAVNDEFKKYPRKNYEVFCTQTVQSVGLTRVPGIVVENVCAWITVH